MDICPVVVCGRHLLVRIRHPPEVPAVIMSLAEPPVVVSQGRATHGVARLVDEFQLPDLWSLHLYDYSAELEVDGTGYAITPGSVASNSSARLMGRTLPAMSRLLSMV